VWLTTACIAARARGRAGAPAPALGPSPPSRRAPPTAPPPAALHAAVPIPSQSDVTLFVTGHMTRGANFFDHEKKAKAKSVIRI